MKDIFKPAIEPELRQRRLRRLIEVCPGNFIKIIGIIGDIQIKREDIQIKNSHPRPRKLPAGMMCVCVFLWGRNGYCFKITKAKTQQEIDREYDSRVKGSFARISRKRLPRAIGSSNVRDWIRECTDRFDFILPKRKGDNVLNLLETFLRMSLYHIY